jgi:CheY-like chemotaxis protein
MQISCTKCQNQISVPDKKIPKGRVFHLTCPKCKKRIPVDVSEEPEPEENGGADQDSWVSETCDSAGRPFDFIEEDTKTVLICKTEVESRKQVVSMLEQLDYRITEAETARDALRRMRYHAYDMVVIDEAFDSRDAESNGVLLYIRQMHMETRRNLFVVLFSEAERTMDKLAAFRHSVNLVIHPKDLKFMNKLLVRGIAENETFYRMMKFVIREVTGR